MNLQIEPLKTLTEKELYAFLVQALSNAKITTFRSKSGKIYKIADTHELITEK